MSKKKVKVFWTNREKRELAIALKAEASTTGMLTVRLIQEVSNRIFPLERRRTIVSYDNVPWLKDMMTDIRDTEPVIEEVIIEPLSQVSPVEEIVKQLLIMMAPVIKQIAESLIKETIVLTGDTIAEVIKHQPIHAGKEGKVRKLKVVVVGMMNKEAARLKQEFGNTFNLSVYNHNQSLHALRAALPSADEVIVSTANCTHSAEEVVKSNFLGKHVRLTGGYTTMKEYLQSLSQTQAH